MILAGNFPSDFVTVDHEIILKVPFFSDA